MVEESDDCVRKWGLFSSRNSSWSIAPSPSTSLAQTSVLEETIRKSEASLNKLTCQLEWQLKFQEFSSKEIAYAQKNKIFWAFQMQISSYLTAKYRIRQPIMHDKFINFGHILCNKKCQTEGKYNGIALLFTAITNFLFLLIQNGESKTD